MCWSWGQLWTIEEYHRFNDKKSAVNSNAKNVRVGNGANSGHVQIYHWCNKKKSPVIFKARNLRVCNGPNSGHFQIYHRVDYEANFRYINDYYDMKIVFDQMQFGTSLSILAFKLKLFSFIFIGDVCEGVISLQNTNSQTSDTEISWGLSLDQFCIRRSCILLHNWLKDNNPQTMSIQKM